MGRLGHDVPVHCGECGEHIEGCQGLLGEWKHTRSNREVCVRGTVARPETPTEFDTRVYGQSHKQKGAPAG